MAAELPNIDALPASAMLSASEVARLFGISINTVWRWAKDERIAKPVKLGPNVTRWRAGDIRERLSAPTSSCKRCEK